MENKRVLVFDDEQDLLYLCQLVLESKGYEVNLRDNCRNAVADVQSYNPHIVIIDHLIPDDGGVSATKAIKSSHPQMPVILLTASRNIEKLSADAGCDDYLAKPFDIHDLVDMVNKYAVHSA